MYLSVLFVGAAVAGFSIVWAQCPLECVCEDTDLGKKAKCSEQNLTCLIPQVKHDTFKILDISFNNIAILENRVFDNKSLVELTHLNMSRNVIREIDDGAFYLLTDLNILDLSHNNLSSLRPSAFEPLFQSLAELYLNDNPLLVISQGFSFYNLKSMDLSNCHLRTLPGKFFENSTKITNINLKSNEMERFEDLADISKLKDLIRLNLKRNKMQELERELLRMDDKILIDLADNPWICDCNFLNNVFYSYQEREYSPDLTCGAPVDIQGQVVSTSLADHRCNTYGLPASDSISVGNVLVPSIIFGTTVVIFIAFVLIERKWKCFDCVGNGYEVKVRKPGSKAYNLL